MQYKMITADTPAGLAQAVQEGIGNGYLLGGPIVSTTVDRTVTPNVDKVTYCQAVIAATPDDKLSPVERTLA